MRYVLIVGNIIDGFKLYGPFDDYDDATDFAEGDLYIRDDVYHVVEMEDPKNAD